MKFAMNKNSWFNNLMKNSNSIANEKTTSQYLNSRNFKEKKNCTNINELLNRVKVNQKNEYRKKLYFSTAASAGVILFGLIIF